MTLSMPIRRPLLPSTINGQVNGAVDTSLLSWVEANRTGPVWLMADLPARSMRAAHARAREAGIILTSTGRGRSLAQQWLIFGGGSARYRPVSSEEYTAAPPANRKFWGLLDYVTPSGDRAPGRISVGKTLGITIPNSSFWIKIRNANGGFPATAAVPGTSNHGWWCADDLAEIVDGRLVSLRPSTVQWCYANLPDFGFHWETTAEQWHVHWTNGDWLTQATLEFERGSQPTPPPDYDDEMSKIVQVNDGDIALFVKTGTYVSWIDDINLANALVWLREAEHAGPLGELPVKPILLDRGYIGLWTLIGRAPVYPDGYAGPRTTAANFRAHQP